MSFTFLHLEISWGVNVDLAPCSSWLMRKPNMDVFSYMDNNGYVCIYLIRYKKNRYVYGGNVIYVFGNVYVQKYLQCTQ